MSVEKYKSPSELSDHIIFRADNKSVRLTNLTDEECEIRFKIGTRTIKIGTLGKPSTRSLILKPNVDLNIYLDVNEDINSKNIKMFLTHKGTLY